MLQCPSVDDPDIVPAPNSLVVQLHNGRTTFKLQSLTFSECTVDNPEIKNSPGELRGVGLGTCNGATASANFTLRDGPAGFDPKAGDRVTMGIEGLADGCDFFSGLGALLPGGNLTLKSVDNPELWGS